MELIEGGLLKRSAFDVVLETDTESSNLLSVSIHELELLSLFMSIFK